MLFNKPHFCFFSILFMFPRWYFCQHLWTSGRLLLHMVDEKVIFRTHIFVIYIFSPFTFEFEFWDFLVFWFLIWVCCQRYPYLPSRVLNAQKIKFFVHDFYSKYKQISNFLGICSHFRKKPVMENFIFCAVFCRTPVMK